MVSATTVLRMDIEGIKHVLWSEEVNPEFVPDKGEVRIASIVPQSYIDTNAYYRSKEDQQAGREVQEPEAYLAQAKEYFEKLGLVVVSDWLYGKYNIQRLCGEYGQIIFLSGK